MKGESMPVADIVKSLRRRRDPQSLQAAIILETVNTIIDIDGLMRRGVTDAAEAGQEEHR